MEYIDKISIIVFSILLGCFFALGWFGNEYYYNLKDNDLRTKGFMAWNMTKTQVTELAYDKTSTGQWVCINVNYKDSFEDLVKTCQHEAGHELFARKCAEDPKLCFDVEKLK
jgi:hypothetical protein